MVQNNNQQKRFNPGVLPNEPIVPTVGIPQQAKFSIEQAIAAAERHQQVGQLQQAEQILRQVLQSVPEQPFALHLLGVIAHGAGKEDVAINLITKAISVKGDVALFHANLSEMLRREKRYDEAITHGEKAVSLDRNMVSAHSNLGIAYFDKEDYEKARACHDKALKINPSFPPSLNNVGSIYRADKEYETAKEYFEKAIAADNGFLDPQNNLGEVLTRLEKPEEAIEVLDRVLAKNPQYDSALCNKGLALLTLGQETQAQQFFYQALQIDENFPPALTGLVLISLELNTYEEGENCARKLVAVEPDKPDSHSMLGSILLARGETELARQSFQEALDIDPDFVAAKSGMGHILMEMGDIAEAEILFRSCMKDKDDDETSPAVYSLIQVKKTKPGDPEIAMMEKEAEKISDSMPSSKSISLHFGLGKMYDDLGEYDKGFPYYIEGCRLKREKLNYNMQEKEDNVSRTMETFSKSFIEKNKGTGDPSELPIFVLGMPRSGTTLTEQIIASHPTVFGAGELRELIALTESYPPERVGVPLTSKVLDMSPEQFAEMGSRYVEDLRKYDADAVKITDKMPGNFNYVGLIHMIMPNAKIVHVNRHPLDTCVSCFTRLFAHGQANTYNLTELGHFYKCYNDLMNHWRQVLPKGSFYDLYYEDLIEDTEGQAKKLIEYCGLDWDDNCLEFYKHKRSIRTASVTQVRQPIYKTSKQRWKNYEKFLEPLIVAMGDAYQEEKPVKQIKSSKKTAVKTATTKKAPVKKAATQASKKRTSKVKKAS